MKNLSLLAALLIFACAEKQATEIPYTAVVHPYAVAEFEDSASIQKVSELLPAVDQMYDAYARQNHFPSLSYGIVLNGELIHHKSFGFSDIEGEAKASVQTLYRIASMSKSFTAMAILKLRDEGKLNLTDAVARYIPEMNQVKKPTIDAPEITLQHLLTMSAGFPEDNPWGDRQLDASDEALLEVLREGISFSNVPGVSFEYSNLGYALLGKVIGNISGQPYQAYVKENILDPLGMHDTQYEYSDIPAEQLALGYFWQDGEWEGVPLMHDGAYGAMGGMWSSIADFSKYVAFHLSAWPPRDEDEAGPVRRSSIREMHQPWQFINLNSQDKSSTGESCPNVVAYGYGLSWRKDCRGIVRISHSGGLPGFGSEWRIYPDYGIGVFSFSNNTYGAPSAVNARALDTLVAAGNLQHRVIPPSDILSQRKSEIVQLLPEWKVEDPGIFADNFFQDIPYERRKKAVNQVFDEAGSILSVGELDPLNQLRGSFLLEGTHKDIRIFFTLNPQKEAFIQRMDVRVVEK